MSRLDSLPNGVPIIDLVALRSEQEFFDSSKVEEGSLLHLVKALLRYDPKARLTAAQGLNHVFFTTGRYVREAGFSQC